MLHHRGKIIINLLNGSSKKLNQILLCLNSRIADHAHPWDDETNDGTISRRSFTPYLTGNPGLKHGKLLTDVFLLFLF